MKKILFIFLFPYLFIANINAQNVGINTTGGVPNSSAGLDIDFTNKGLLIPRVALTQTTSNAPIGAGVTTSLLVYNTNAINDVVLGFYYWDGSKWVKLNAPIGDDWLKATTSTTPAINTDNQYVKGSVGIGDFSTANPTAKLDVNGDNIQQVLNVNGTNQPEILLQHNGASKLEIGIPTSNNAYIANTVPNDVIFRQSGGQKILFSTHSTGLTNDLTISAGNIGINTAAPVNRLHVMHSSNNEGLLLQNTTGGAGSTTNILFSTYSDISSVNRPGAQISAIDDAGYSAHLSFGSKTPGLDINTIKERMRIQSNGVVGIIGQGTSIPNYPLESNLILGTNSTSEGGQLQLNAASNYTTAHFIDNYEDNLRIITGNNAGSSTVRMIMNNNGNFGINTAGLPTEKLEINGKIKITDGTQGVGKVLTSDANGVGTWTTNVAITPAVYGVFGSGANISTSQVYTNAYITLPPGKWILFGTYLMNGSTTLTSGQSVWVRTYFGESNTVSGSTGDVVRASLISGALTGPERYGLANGQIILNNTSGASKTYYVWASIEIMSAPGGFVLSNFGASTWGENQIVAIPMN